MPQISYVSSEEYETLRVEVHELREIVKELLNIVPSAASTTHYTYLAHVYTVKELAKRLAISDRGAYELIRRGRIEYYCLNKKNYRVSERAVRQFEQALAVSPKRR